MMKPLLLVSAIALAAPVLAQSTTHGGTAGTTTTGGTSHGTTGTSTGTTTNDDVGAVGGNTVNSQNTTQHPIGDDADTTDHSAMGHGSTGTAGTMGTSTSGTAGSMGAQGMGTTGSGTMTGTGTMSGTGSASMGGTGMSQGTMGTTGGTAGASAQATAANWNNGVGMAIQPGNSNPERDARGIAVISAPASVPGGWNGTAGTAMGGPLLDAGTGASAGAQSYPACSAAITDNCIQSYERGRGR